MRSATRKKTGKSPEYLAWLHTLPCIVCILPWKLNQSGVSYSNVQKTKTEAAHLGAHGISQKAPDRQAVPMCRFHHQTGPESLHNIGPKRFWALHRLDPNTIISALNAKYDKLKEQA